MLCRSAVRPVGEVRFLQPGRVIASPRLFLRHMTLTRYLKTFQDGDEPGSLILFSAKKGSIISIPSGMFAELEAGSISEEELKTLSDLGFLCEGPDAERKEMLGFIDDLNVISRTFAAKVVMNLDCNLACKYCFEGQRKGKFYMTRDTADLFIAFVRDWAEGLEGRTGDEKIAITFYGGEPLLSLDLVAYLSERIKSIAEEEGIEYIAYIVTNGTLFTPRIVERLKPLGLRGAVVTLDGPTELHDLFRPFKSGKCSFDRIVGNLREVCEMTGIQLGGNYMSDNYREFPRLLDFMLANGLTPDKVESVRFNPVTAESYGYGPVDFNEGCCSFNEPWLFEAGVYLSGEVLKRGYNGARSTLPGVCSLDMEDNYLVNYDGNIFKCPGLIGRDEFKVGDLKTGIRFKSQPQGRDCWKNEECLTCIYLPLCFGGCRQMRLVREGNMDGVECKKPYLDATLEAFVKQDIKYGLSST